MKILFVCTGNTCRSPMAEGYFKYLLEQSGVSFVEVRSAGTAAFNGGYVSENSVKVLREIGIDISSYKSSALTRELALEADLIITMGHSHRYQIVSALPELENKVHLLMEFADQDRDVADPYGGYIEVYKACFDDMKPALDNLLLDIMKND